MKYRAEIEGLRALAVVPVILFHAGFEPFSGGFVGVDVFFVISGYLITTILIEDLENQRFSLVNFYERRARRILPALFFVMLVCIPFAWMWMLPSQMKEFSQSLVAVSLFASNILFWRKSGYFDAAAEEKPLLHTWSLAVEEQYYVLFPIFLFLAWRYGKNRVFWMIVVMASISLLLSEWGWRNKATANFYLAPTRAWELFAGSIAAFIVQKNGVQKNNFLALLGLATIIFSIFVYDETTPFPSVYALVPVLGVVLLVLYADRETLAAKLLSTKAFVGVGYISYSAYLWHQPLFAFTRIRSLEHPSLLLMLALSFLSMLMAYISWRYVEKPFRQSQLVSRKIRLLSFFIGIFLLLTIGSIGYFTDGFKAHILNARQIALVDSLERSNLPACKKCFEEFFQQGESRQGREIVLIGDSNADHFSVGLQSIADDLGYSLHTLTYPGCMPLAEFYRLDKSPGVNAECLSFNRLFKETLSKNNEKFDVIIVSAAWLLYFYGSEVLDGIANYSGTPIISSPNLSLDGSNPIKPEEREEIFVEYFNNLLSQLLSNANKVIVVGPLPPSIVRFDNKFAIRNPKLLITDQYLTSISAFSRALNKSLISHQVSFIDLASELCRERECEVIRNDKFLYSDPTHLSHYGQLTVIAPMLEKLLR